MKLNFTEIFPKVKIVTNKFTTFFDVFGWCSILLFRLRKHFEKISPKRITSSDLIPETLFDNNDLNKLILKIMCSEKIKMHVVQQNQLV